MSVNIRVPFTDALYNRDTSFDKDAFTANTFFEAVPEGVAVVKRPGLENKTSALGIGFGGSLGLGLGIFYYQDKVYSFNSIDPGTQWIGFAKSPTSAVLISGPGTSAIIKNVSLKEMDVLEYTEQASGAGIDGGFTSLVYTGTRFIAHGTFTLENFIRLSNDGITWTAGQLLSSNMSEGTMAVKGSTIVLITQTADYIAVSTDNGTSWVETNIAKGSSNNKAIAVLGANFTIGSFYSPNGTTWTVCTGSGAGPMRHLTSNGSYILGFGSFSSQMKFSNNGIAWSNVTPVGVEAATSMVPGTLLQWSGTYWCAVTPNGKSFTSTDGTNWTKGNRQQSVFVIPKNLIFFNNTFYCLSETPQSTTGNPFALTFLEFSRDGINWETSVLDLALFDPTPTILTGLV